MKLWLIEAIYDSECRGVSPHGDDDPWEEPWDKHSGFVIRAETEERARQIACESAADEGGDAWLSAKYSTCVELTTGGEEGVVMVHSL